MGILHSWAARSDPRVQTLREEQSATDVEVEAAIAALSLSDLRKLSDAAEFRIAG